MIQKQRTKRGWLAGIIALCVGLLMAAAGQAQELPPPDVIYSNGKIVTVNDAFEIAEAVAVRNGEILAVGTNQAILALASSNTRQVDLEGRTVLPGFWENHAHPGPHEAHPRPTGPLPPSVVDLRYVRTWNEASARLREKLAELPPGAWLRADARRTHFTAEDPGNPFYQEDLSATPNRHDLDKIAPSNPVLIRAGALVVANSQALALAGITRDFQDPSRGSVDRDRNGEPTGLLWYEVGDMVEAIAPPLPRNPPLSDRARMEGYKHFFDDMLSLGVTSINDASATLDVFHLYQRLHEEFPGQVPRLTVQPRVGGNSFEAVEQGIATLRGFGWRTGAGNDWLRLGAVKMGLDGGYTYTRPWALNLEPHKHVPGYHGEWRIEPQYFEPLMRWAHRNGWQLGVHVAGDAAAIAVVDVMERIIREYPRENHRHHMSHFEIPPPERTFKQMSELGIGVALQPGFIHALQPHFVWALEGERLQRNNPARSILDHGIHLSFGSDYRPYPPLVGIYAAVTRKGVDGKVYGPSEAITIEEAIRAYTRGSAWQFFQENRTGTIEVGKLADMVVLGEDILTIDPDQIPNIPIVMTILNGEIAYSAER